MDKKLGKGIAIVFMANIINLFFSLATNFLLPKYLSFDSYAQIKTFQLYVSYIGLLHLGYIDSIYLKYGGKKLGEKLHSDFYEDLSTLRIFQAVVTISAIVIAFAFKDIILLLFAVSILPINMNGYFKFLFQATGDFALYGRIMNVTTILTFIVNMVLLFILRTDLYLYYLLGYVLIYFIVWISLEISFRKKHYLERGRLFSFAILKKNILDGVFLTVGNLASNFLTSMDRWFVKFLLDTIAFAHYSFAVSVESFLNIAITPVTTTLYNFFCREESVEEHRKILKCVIVFATVIPAAAFPVKLILELFLTKYIESTCVIFLLFSAQMFYVVIKSVFVNLYKVQRKQKLYFFKLSMVLLVGFIFNYCFYSVYSVKESFAVGTLLSAIVWFIITIKDFKYMLIPRNCFLYLVFELVAFLLCGFFLNSIIGCVIYVVFTMICLVFFMRDTVIFGMSVVQSVMHRK